MPDPTFETRLAQQLGTYAESGVRPIDRHAIAEATIATGARRGLTLPRLWPERGSLVPVLLGLLLLTLAAAAIGVGSFLLRAPSPSVPRSGYDGVVVRPIAGTPVTGLEVIAVRADGTERVVRRLTSSDVRDEWAFTGGGQASQDGWIAMLGAGPSDPPAFRQTQHAWALFDLGDPTRPPSLLPTDHGGAWGGAHAFATSVGRFSLDSVQTMDAAIGTTHTLTVPQLPGGGPDIIWAEDESGILVTLPTSPRYAIKPIDGGPAIPVVPQLAPHRGSRYVAAGGASLENCAGDATCPGSGRPGGTVSILDAAGAATTWYRGEFAPARLLDASFSADGASVWLLLERIEGTHHVADLAARC